MARILSSQVTHVAAYEPPGFGFLSRWPDLAGAAYLCLKEFGAKATQIKPEGASWQPPDLTVACHLFDYEASVRYRVDSVEVFTANLERAGSGDVAHILAAAVRALVQLDATAHIERHALDISAHLDLGNVAVEAFLARFLTPEASSEYRPVSVMLQADISSHAGKAALTLERSYVHKGDNKLFLRLHCDFPRTIALADAFHPTETRFRDMLGRLGVDS